MIMVPIKEALTFDDVTLVPKYSEILPAEVDTSIKLTKYLKLKIPLLSSAMDTVTESKMAIAMANAGGLGIIHRNLDIKNQIIEIKKVKKKNLLVGAAVGAGPKEFKRVEAILKEKIDMIVVDTAHGHTKKVSEIIKFIKKKKNKKTALCAGNIATPEAARFLLQLGVDIIKVGIGPGSICTTRLVAGIGVPQLSAILNVRNGIKKKDAKIISDGGIKYSGDLAKAFAAGADAVMIGSLFAGTDEAPGRLIRRNGKLFKSFRGMGSVGAMNQGSADRYSQLKQKDISKYVPEGVEGFAKYKGKVGLIIYKLVGGLKSSMGYLGSKQIKYLRNKPQFVKITKAGFYESMVHNVDIIKNDNWNMIKFFKNIIIFYFLLNILNFSIGSENFFNKGLQLYQDKKFDDARFMFERSIVFNPKNSNSYLYLAKIYNLEEDRSKEEKNLNAALLIEPNNEEAILMLMKIGLEKTNYSKVKDLSKKFEQVCKKLCKENKSIIETLINLEPKNESWKKYW